MLAIYKTLVVPLANSYCVFCASLLRLKLTLTLLTLSDPQTKTTLYLHITDGLFSRLLLWLFNYPDGSVASDKWKLSRRSNIHFET